MNYIFEKLRDENPVFVYKSFDLKIKGNEINIQYHFHQSDDIEFFPTIKMILPDDRKYGNLKLEKLQAIVFNIGMIELISYWKACASPKIIIEAGYLDDKQLDFWNEVYYQGLGEFLYVNKVAISRDKLFEISVTSKKHFKKEQFILNDGNIIPIGGGKDSVVSLEMLADTLERNYCFLLNPVQAARDTAEIAGFPPERTIVIERKLDQKLLELNSQGYLNGHTPFSALLAFVSAFAAIVYECKNIVLSNENSASEGNLYYNDMNVNHQYSKSFDAEKHIHNYLTGYICDNINYFSLLRPLYEIQIAKIFSGMDKYHKAFRSCNKGSKLNIWCGSCSKCLFVYLILSPFVRDEKLEEIFGQNLLQNHALIPTYQAMLGLKDNKPFDCVGTYREVKIVSALLLRSYKLRNKKLPVILEDFEQKFGNEVGQLAQEANRLLLNFNSENLLDREYSEILKKHLH